MKKLKTNVATIAAVLAAGAFMASAGSALASTDTGASQNAVVSSGLVLPRMNAAEGRQLFASKGCVVCHSVNGIGGEDAPMLDAEFMELPMNPFDFAANMWRGAETMVMMQREEMGDVIEISGQDLANIIAFVHDPDEQEKFSGDDIPENMKELMEHAETEEEDAHD